MAELMFKRGSQSALNAIITGQTAVDGCFYLTEDTHRLYVGQGDNTAPVLLNQTVQVVNTLDDLPSSPPATDNDFYYIKSLNILAVFDSSQPEGKKWVQINPDTDTNDVIEVTGAEFSAGVSDATNDTVTYKLTLKQQKTDVDGKETELADIEADLVLTSELVAGLVPEAAEVSVKAETSGNGAAIKTQGAGADSSKVVTLTPGTNVAITVENGIVTFAATDTTYTHEVSTEGGKVSVKLVGTDGSDTPIEFAVGESNDDLEVSGDATSDKVIYSHKDYNTADKSVTNDTLVAGGNLNIITGINLSNGHVSEIKTGTVTLPEDTQITNIKNTNTEDWKVTIEQSNGANKEISFATDAAALEAKLSEMITNGLAAANTAMTYKGTVTSYSNLPTSNVEVGDVYLLSAADGNYKIGDLWIATSSKVNDTGVIDEDANLVWTYVPAGDELNTDTLFKGQVTLDDANNSVTYGIRPISESGAENVDGNEDLTISTGLDLELTGTDSNAVISHREVDTKDNKSNAKTVGSYNKFTAISDVKINNGHVEEIEYSEFTTDEYELTGADNKIKLTATNSGADAGAISVEGDTWINTAVAGDKLTITHKGPGTAATTKEAVNANKNLAASGALNIISKVAYDSKGHITEVATDSLTLPADTTYELITSTTSDGVAVASDTKDPYLVLKGSNDSATHTQFVGAGSLSVVGNASQVAISMVWGSF
jgi:hypothetical protein